MYPVLCDMIFGPVEIFLSLLPTLLILLAAAAVLTGLVVLILHLRKKRA